MSVQIDLKGKTALLTGGGRGLGKAIAEVLARAGANVFIGNRKEAEGKSVVDEILKLGVKAEFKKSAWGFGFMIFVVFPMGMKWLKGESHDCD